MAGVSRAGGYPDYSSSGTIGFNPELWATTLVPKFYESTVFGSIASTEYEGLIKNLGDNIIIRTVPDITVSDYQIGSTFSQSDYEVPQSTLVELPIDKAKKFMYRINTVDRAQSDLDLAEVFADEASMKLKIAMDRDMLANIYSQAAAANQGSTAGAISGNIQLGTTTPIGVNTSNAIDYILRCGQVLDEQNVSDEGRWLVLPAWFIKKIKGSELKDASLAGDAQSIARNGRVGMIDRFTIFQSNLLDVTAGSPDYTNIVFGHKAGLAWASQICEMERITNPFDFGHLARGLCVYGYKVVEPKYIGWGRVNEAAEA